MYTPEVLSGLSEDVETRETPNTFISYNLQKAFLPLLSPNFNQVLVPKIRLNELSFHEWFYQIPKCRKSFDYY